MSTGHNFSLLYCPLFSYATCYAEKAIATAPGAQTKPRRHGGDLLDKAWLSPAHCECVLPVCCTSLQMTAAGPEHAQPASNKLLLYSLRSAFQLSCEATGCSGPIPLALVSTAAAVHCNT